MKFTVFEFATSIELNDFKINSVELDIKNREFKLTLEGAYWFENSESKPKAMENGGIISVLSYKSFEARRFSTKDKKTVSGII